MVDWTAVIPSHVPSSARTHIASSEMKKYVYFSDLTSGGTGKAVRIKIDLFTRFASLVDPKSNSGKMTIRQIEALRNAAGVAAGSLNNINSAFKYMHRVKDMCVHYSILNDCEGTRKPTVFITDIRPDFGGRGDKAGLYNVDAFDGGVSFSNTTDLAEKSVFVSGNASDIEGAAEAAYECMPTVNAIYYSPSNVINDLGVWASSVQSQATKDAVSELSKLIQVNAKKRVYWTAEGEGAAMVDQALDGTVSKLNMHSIRLVDPVADTPSLLHKIQRKEMKLGGGKDTITETSPEPVLYTGKRRASQILLQAQRQSLLERLNELKFQVMKDNRPSHTEMVSQLSRTSSANKFQKSKNSLAKSPASDHRPGNIRPQNTDLLSETLSKSRLTFVGAIQRI